MPMIIVKSIILVLGESCYGTPSWEMEASTFCRYYPSKTRPYIIQLLASRRRFRGSFQTQDDKLAWLSACPCFSQLLFFIDDAEDYFQGGVQGRGGKCYLLENATLLSWQTNRRKSGLMDGWWSRYGFGVAGRNSNFKGNVKKTVNDESDAADGVSFRGRKNLKNILIKVLQQLDFSLKSRFYYITVARTASESTKNFSANFKGNILTVYL